MTFRMLRLVAVLCLIAAASAQTKPAPKGASPDFSGRYSFLRDGEDIQINVSEGRVDGYITRFGETDSDQGTMLQHVFDKATLSGDQLSFTTKPVHSIWYEFAGKVERGPAKTRGEDGYYQLVGTLTEHTQQNGKDAGARSRQVTFKLFGDEEPPK
jgi:hypothetical protein